MEATKTPKVLSASTLKGDKVTNAKGEDLSTVEEIMLDLERDLSRPRFSSLPQ
jgi:sporulation protein YlmC with PRC-barrel domain